LLARLIHLIHLAHLVHPAQRGRLVLLAAARLA
jgi:hypothetical protein